MGPVTGYTPPAMLRRTTVLPALIALALVGGGGGALYWYTNQVAADEASEARELRATEREERREQAMGWLQDVQSESRDLMPPMLEGIGLGMGLDEVRGQRGEGLQPSRNREEGKIWMEEHLRNGAQILLGFEASSRRLIQVQVLSRVPVEAIGPHLTAMSEQYGSPTGIWDCPNTGGLPTRRFTWRKNHTTIADVFLVHPGGISITLYIAPTETIGNSLRIAACRPIQSREDLGNFPIATPEQVRQVAEETGTPVVH